MSATAVEPATIEALDFAYEPPCEHSQHHVRHDTAQAASWVITTRCPKCGKFANYLICDSGLAAFFRGKQSDPECGFASHTPGVFIVATKSIRSDGPA